MSATKPDVQTIYGEIIKLRDIAAAAVASGKAPWHQVGESGEVHCDEDLFVSNSWEIPVAVHIAENDPARVTALCDLAELLLSYVAIPDPHEPYEDCPDCKLLYALARAFPAT